MYHVYHGNDVVKVRQSALAFARTSAGAEGSFQVLTEGDVTESLLTDAIGATSLFREREVFVLDTISRDDEAFDTLMEFLEDLKASSNVFVIIEEKLGVKDEKIFSEYAEEITAHTGTGARDYNIFGLADALALRDKKALWIKVADAWREGKASEEIIGTLFWQLKCIRLASLTKSAEEAELKQFVYDKAKRALTKYTLAEIADRSHALVVLYHEGHSGKRDINGALEQWVLKL